ncbi:MAG: hypothetical protein ABIG35_02600 [Pseudomonadota bacterium]
MGIVTITDSAAHTHLIKSIHCGGAGIIWLEGEDYAVEPGKTPNAEKMTIAKFEARLVEQMVGSFPCTDHQLPFVRQTLP